MTASTEQERQAFESFVLSEGYFSESDLVWNGVDEYDCIDADDAFRIWQAARRAQVVPENCDLCKDDGGYFYGRTGYEPCCVYTAPKPPEAGLKRENPTSNPEAACNPSMQPKLATLAAPVQMPEPAGWVDDGGMLFWTEDTPPDGENIYTEHQVRQLLAAHGMK